VLVAGAVAVEAVLLIGSPQALVNADYPAFIAAGRLLATVPVAIVLHALLAFPSGRLTTRPARTLTAVGYLVTTVVLAPQYLFTPLPAPYDPLFVADRPDVLAVLNPAVTIVVRRVRAGHRRGPGAPARHRGGGHPSRPRRHLTVELPSEGTRTISLAKLIIKQQLPASRLRDSPAPRPASLHHPRPAHPVGHQAPVGVPRAGLTSQDGWPRALRSPTPTSSPELGARSSPTLYAVAGSSTSELVVSSPCLSRANDDQTDHWAWTRAICWLI